MGVAQQGQIQPQMMTQIGNTAATMLQYPQAQMYQQSQLGQMQQVNFDPIIKLNFSDRTLRN